MKRLFSLLLLLVLVAAGSTKLVAQDGGYFTPDVQFRSVGLSVGMYSPSMDYFDRTYWSFDSGANFGIDAEVDITKLLGIRAGVGMYSTSSEIQRAAIMPVETMTYTLVPVSLGWYARYDLGPVVAGFHNNVDFNSITAKYEAGSEEQSQSGKATTFNFGLSLERAIGNFGVQVYGRYAIGEFEQMVGNNAEKVDLSGLQAGVTVRVYSGAFKSLTSR